MINVLWIVSFALAIILTCENLLLRISRFKRLCVFFMVRYLKFPFSIKNCSVFFLDPSSFIYKSNHQISNLSVIINGNSGREYQWNSSLCIFAKICLIFKNLTHFHYHVENKSIYKPMTLSALHPKTMCYSSSIVHLNIKVKTFNDCLWTLDGHLSQLHTLIVYIEHIHNTSTIIKNTVRCWKWQLKIPLSIRLLYRITEWVDMEKWV